MDTATVRTFVVAADAGQFQHAALELSITQQAVSKRVRVLEDELEVRLFTRTPRGVELTVDGQAFLPHARTLLRAAERAEASVRPGRRALRVDVVSRQIAPAALLRDFHAAHPDLALDVVTLGASNIRAAAEAVAAGRIDASLRAVPEPGDLPDDVVATRVLDEPHQLLCGPRHHLAGHEELTPTQLAGHRLWIPGITPDTEWATYYRALAAAFDLRIETLGPRSGAEHLLDVLADDPGIATLVGDRTRMLWPDAYDLRRIPLRDPTPVYPHDLLHRHDNPHPALRLLLDHLTARVAPADDRAVWLPPWAAT